MESISALIFFGACLFIPMLCDALYALALNDKSVEQVEVIKYVYIEKSEPVLKKQDKIKEEINPIKKDAMQCLVSLGMKKAEASKKVNEMFAKTDYKTIESFLLEVYKL